MSSGLLLFIVALGNAGVAASCAMLAIALRKFQKEAALTFLAQAKLAVAQAEEIDKLNRLLARVIDVQAVSLGVLLNAGLVTEAELAQVGVVVEEEQQPTGRPS